jgi:hypothetical protein
VLDLYIAVANIVFFFGLLGAYLIRIALVGRRRHARTDADGGSLFLNKRTMEMVYWILDPVIDFLAALRITPNMVTLFSLLPAAGRSASAGSGSPPCWRWWRPSATSSTACWPARPACRRARAR